MSFLVKGVQWVPMSKWLGVIDGDKNDLDNIKCEKWFLVIVKGIALWKFIEKDHTITNFQK